MKGQAVRLASRPPVASDEMRFRCYGIFPADRLAVKETVVLSLDISHLSLVLLAAFAVPATQASPSAACRVCLARADRKLIGLDAKDQKLGKADQRQDLYRP